MAVFGDILFNGRCDVLSPTGFDINVASTVKQKIAQNGLQSLGKAAKHNKHTTGKSSQTLLRFLGILHGKLPIYILDRVSALYKQLSYYALVNRGRSVGFVFNQPRNWDKLSSVIA